MELAKFVVNLPPGAKGIIADVYSAIQKHMYGDNPNPLHSVYMTKSIDGGALGWSVQSRLMQTLMGRHQWTRVAEVWSVLVVRELVPPVVLQRRKVVDVMLNQLRALDSGNERTNPVATKHQIRKMRALAQIIDAGAH
jgi:hypothetical protein